MEEDKFRIVVKIANREYPMTIKRSEEEKIRRAARQISDMVFSYRKQYLADTSDYLAMAALQTAIRSIEGESMLEMAPVVEGLEKWEAELDKFLEQQ